MTYNAITICLHESSSCGAIVILISRKPSQAIAIHAQTFFTWLNDDIDNSELKLPGYHILSRVDKDHGKGRGGGVIVYVRDDVTVNAIPITSTFAQAAKIQIGNIKVTTVYRSPNSTEDNNRALNGHRSFRTSHHSKQPILISL